MNQRKILEKHLFFLTELKEDFLKPALSIRAVRWERLFKRAWTVIVSISLAAKIPLIAYIVLYYMTSRLECLSSLEFQDK